jgi:KipI family sensor histidine kinase inhibitor
MPAVDIRPVGDAALLVVAGDRVDIELLPHIWSLARAIEEAGRGAFLDVVPAYSSVLVRFDPLAIDLAAAMAIARGAAERAAAFPAPRSRHITIGVRFGGEFGVDFETAAHELGMREARFRDAFCKPDYRVAFLGFVAGFPYMLGLPPALALPRLPTPRPRVPAGSVAIASVQCGVYPRQTPGGWRLLGRTLAPIFEPERDEPALLRPADLVRFEPVESLEDTARVRVAEIAS